MLLLKRLVIALAVVIVGFYAVGLALPSSFSVQRSILIQAPVSDVYAQIVDLRRWQGWGVWFKRDPDMQLSFSGPDRAVGMRSQWQSVTEGNGMMTIKSLEHDKRVVYDLWFPEMEMGSTGEFVLEVTEQGTRVTWKDYGDVGSNIVYRYFGLFMDQMLGPDFEDGLANLKTVSENTPG